jgi:hypothetical protein
VADEGCPVNFPVPSPPLISAHAAGRALHLAPRTVAWLADHPQARQFVGSVWDKLAELERTGQFPAPSTRCGGSWVKPRS